MDVEVVRSGRRKRTVQARMVGNRLQVSIPAWMSKADERHWVAEMLRRWNGRSAGPGHDLEERAAVLARRYRLPRPTSVRWVTNQQSRWGSCTPADGTIRISSRLKSFPTWVLDYVLVHEIAHLVEPGHDTRFRALEHRYPKTERAIGFLIAKGLEGDQAEAVSPTVPSARVHGRAVRNARSRAAALCEPLRLPGF